MGVPTVMGVSDVPIAELQHKEIIVDGYYGQIYICPRASLREEFEQLIQEEKQLDESFKSIARRTGGNKRSAAYHVDGEYWSWARMLAARWRSVRRASVYIARKFLF